MKNIFKFKKPDAKRIFKKEYEKAMKGDYQSALYAFNDVHVQNPDNLAALCNRGNAYKELGDYENALKDYNRIQKLDPKYIDVYLNRGILKETLGDFIGAIDDYTRAIAINDKNDLAYLYRGQLYLNLSIERNFAEEIAIEDIKKASELNNDEAKEILEGINNVKDKKSLDENIIDFNKEY